MDHSQVVFDDYDSDHDDHVNIFDVFNSNLTESIDWHPETESSEILPSKFHSSPEKQHRDGSSLDESSIPEIQSIDEPYNDDLGENNPKEVAPQIDELFPANVGVLDDINLEGYEEIGEYLNQQIDSNAHENLESCDDNILSENQGSPRNSFAKDVNDTKRDSFCRITNNEHLTGDSLHDLPGEEETGTKIVPSPLNFSDSDGNVLQVQHAPRSRRKDDSLSQSPNDSNELVQKQSFSLDDKLPSVSGSSTQNIANRKPPNESARNRHLFDSDSDEDHVKRLPGVNPRHRGRVLKLSWISKDASLDPKVNSIPQASDQGSTLNSDVQGKNSQSVGFKSVRENRRTKWNPELQPQILSVEISSEPLQQSKDLVSDQSLKSPLHGSPYSDYSESTHFSHTFSHRILRQPKLSLEQNMLQDLSEKDSSVEEIKHSSASSPLPSLGSKVSARSSSVTPHESVNEEQNTFIQSPTQTAETLLLQIPSDKDLVKEETSNPSRHGSPPKVTSKREGSMKQSFVTLNKNVDEKQNSNAMPSKPLAESFPVALPSDKDLVQEETFKFVLQESLLDSSNNNRVSNLSGLPSDERVGEQHDSIMLPKQQDLASIVSPENTSSQSTPLDSNENQKSGESTSDSSTKTEKSGAWKFPSIKVPAFFRQSSTKNPSTVTSESKESPKPPNLTSPDTVQKNEGPKFLPSNPLVERPPSPSLHTDASYRALNSPQINVPKPESSGSTKIPKSAELTPGGSTKRTSDYKSLASRFQSLRSNHPGL